MGLGAAGCGYEYDNPNYKCGFLSKDLFQFKCLKYQVELETHERSGHPIRCSKCSDDADKEGWSKIVKERKLNTQSNGI